MSEITRERLNKLHNEDGISWRAIAALDEFKDRGIPAGSLCSFAGGWEPRTDEARKRFGLETIELVKQNRGRNGRFYKRS